MRHTRGKFMPATGRLAVLMPLLIGGLVSDAHAQYTWTGGGGNSSWTTAGNWSTAIPISAASTTIDFTAGAGTVASNNNISDPFQLNALSFDVSTSVFNLSGGALNFITSGGNDPALNQNSNSAINISNNLTLTNNLTLAGVGTGTVTLSGAISGAGSLILSANGTSPNNTGSPNPGTFTTVISNSGNSYTGGTIIAGGVVNLGADNVVPTSGPSAAAPADLTLSATEADATLDLNGHNQTINNLQFGDNNAAYAMVIQNSKSAGALTLTGNIDYNGGLNTTSAAALISSNLVLASGNHSITNQSGNIGLPGYDVVISGAISGAGGLTVDTTSYGLILSHANTYTGATVVGETSTLYLDAKNALSSTNALTLSNASTLYLYFSSQEFALPAPGLTEGAFNQSIGSLSSGTIPGGIFVYLGKANLTVGGDNTSTTFNGNIQDNDGIDTTSTFVTGGSLTKVGTGTLTLSPASGGNTYTGATAIQGGTLKEGTDGALPTSTPLTVTTGTLNGTATTGTFDLNGHKQTVGNLTNSGGNVLTNGGALTATAVTNSAGGSILIAGGSLTATGLTNSSGSVQVTGSGALTLTNLTNSGGNLLADKTSTVTVSGAYSQSAGTVQIDGALNAKNLSVLNLTGGQLVGGGTIASSVTSGSITVNNTKGMVSPGDLLAGSPTGTLNIKGAYTQTSTGKLQIDLGGAAKGNAVNGYDLLTVLNKATLAGELDVNLVNNFDPTVGETFDFLTYGSRSGAFATIASLNSGFSYSVSYNDTTRIGTLTVLTVGVPEASSLLSAGLMLATGGLILRRRRR